MGEQHRTPAGHRLERRKAETLVEARKDEGVGGPVAPDQFGVVDAAEPLDAIALEPVDRGEVAWIGSAGDLEPRTLRETSGGLQ
jgi:hypothetical protein